MPDLVHAPSSHHWVSFVEVYKELLPVILREWDDISSYSQDCECEPDWASYFELEKAGRLRTLVVRNHGKIVGYSIFIIFRNLHCGLREAISDTFYVLPECGNQKIGTHMFKEAKRKLAEDGVKYLMCQAPSDRIGKLFEFLGFSKFQTIWRISLWEMP